MRRADPLGWSNPALLILASLAAGPKHGYAIVKDVEADTGTTLGPGTLYAALVRLEEQGLIEALPGEERRRPYRLTAAGADALAQSMERMARFTRTTSARLASGAGA